MKTTQRLCRAVVATLLAMLGGCGSGGGGDSRNYNTLGGQISMNLVNAPGGAITGLQLYDGVETYDVTLPAQTTGSIPFSFPTALSQGTAYTITVVNSPTGFACTPSANAAGTMGTAEVTNVTVTCTDSVFTVSGTVQLNLVNALTSNVELAISDGSDTISVQLPAGATTATLPAFSFPTALETGAQYKVSVPDNPTDLTCTATNASGTITSTDVKNVLVTCADSAFELSGEVSVSLQNPYTSNTATVVLTDGTNLATSTVTLGSGLTGNESFTFPNLIAQGAPYTVHVATTPLGSPSGLTCTPSNNMGTIASANVTNIAVNCSDAIYSLGGTVTGLQFGGSVLLSDNNESITVGQGPSSFGFTFPTALAYSSPYSVSIQAQSLVQCSLGNATGSVAPVPSVTLTCALPALALLAGSAGSSSNPVITPGNLSLAVPTGVAVDAAGNVYVADSDNNEIRKITPAGVVTTLAGSSTNTSFEPVDGTGAAASFNDPQGIAADAAGNIFVADTGNNLIRKITPAGVVTTVAGSATAGFARPSGIAVDTAGNIYVADTFNNEIRKITPAGVVITLAGSTTIGVADGVGAAAGFYNPQGVAVDAAGNVYVADGGNCEIRKITPTGVVTTLAGSLSIGSADGPGSSASFYFPQGVALDPAGNIYVADGGNNEIRKITPAGVVTTLAGSTNGMGSANGTGAAASFSGPQGVAVDTAGNVYVADTDNFEIREITAAALVTTFAGSVSQSGEQVDGLGNTASFFGAEGVAIDGAGNVYVADKNEIRKITPAGVVTTLAGSGNFGFADGTGSAASFQLPTGVAVDAAGDVYVADTINCDIRKITPAGVVTTLAGSGGGGFADGAGAAASFFYPQGVAVDKEGTVYVADTDNNKIRKITPAGVVTTLAGSGNFGALDGTGSAASFSEPSGVAVDAAGNVYVSDSNEIRKITPAGVVTTLAGSMAGGSTDGTGAAATFYNTQGVAVDTLGNVFVADGSNNIRKITDEGVVTTVIGNSSNLVLLPGSLPGSLGKPSGIALSAPDRQGNWNMVISTTSPGVSGTTLSAVAEVMFANAAFY
jgi:sugar lactone lactonase YvrE